MNKLTVRDLDARGKVIFVRVDFNVPLDPDGGVADDTRIVASLPTIRYLSEKGARIVLASHLGRPKGRHDPRYTLLPVAGRLAHLLKMPVDFASDCVGDDVRKRAEALKDGGVYRDDVGQCWPAGMPMIMTRVWPIAMVQLPTVIYMISHFENSVRIIYLDGRPHTDPDIVVRTFNGESIGHWEGDTLVVDTIYFPGHHHWMDQGGASIPASEDLHIIERFKMMPDGRLDIEYQMTDPKNWVGEWKMTKTFRRQEEKDISEVQCLPDLNDGLPATRSKGLVK